MKNLFQLVILLSVSVAGVSQGKGSLLLSKGQKYLIENKFNVLSTQQMAGQSMESKADFSTSNTIEVKDVKDNNYSLVNTLTKVTTKMNAMGQDMNFDSDKKEDMEGEMGKSMKDVINQPKNVTVDKQGKVIKNIDDTAKKDAGGGMMSMMMDQFLGSQEESGFGLSETFMVLPSDAKAGSSWTDSSTNSGVKKSTTYTIKEIKGNEATVTMAGTLDMDTKTEVQGMDIATKTSGKLSGEQTVDIKSGVVKQRTTNLDSSGNVQVMGQEVPITTKLNAVSVIKLM